MLNLVSLWPVLVAIPAAGYTGLHSELLCWPGVMPFSGTAHWKYYSPAALTHILAVVLAKRHCSTHTGARRGHWL